MTLDVKAAFLYGDTKRDLYIELPKQDPWADDFFWVGKLRKAMYGTRDAPQAETRPELEGALECPAFQRQAPQAAGVVQRTAGLR